MYIYIGASFEASLEERAAALARRGGAQIYIVKTAAAVASASTNDRGAGVKTAAAAASASTSE